MALDLARRYVAVLDGRAKWVVLAFWLVCAALAAWQAPLVIARTTTAFSPPAWSLASIGSSQLSQAFPGQSAEAATFALYIQGNGSDWVTQSQLKAFSMALNRTIADPVLVFQGYYTLASLGLPPQAYSQFRAPDGSSTFFSVAVNLHFSDPVAIAWALDFERTIEALRVEHIPEAQCSLLGVAAFLPVLISDVERNLGLVDAISIPLALLLFAAMVKSLRLVLLPIASMVLSLGVSFAAVTVMTYFTPVMSYLPSLLMSVIVAMSFDYALFLLLRFREELLKAPAGRVDVPQHVTVVLRTAGHTVSVSGAILILTFVVLCFLPLTFIAITGVGAFVSVALAMLVNLTLIPALLLAFPSFFARAVEPFSCCGRRITYGARSTADYTPLVESVASHAGNALTAPEIEAMRSSNWYRTGNLNVKPLTGVLFIVAVFALVAPLAAFSWSYVPSDALVQDLPRGSAVAEGYTNFTRAFGPGFSMPVQLLLVAKNGARVDTAAFFDTAARIVTAIAERTNTSAHSWSGVVYNADVPPRLWHALYGACHQAVPPDTAICRAVALGDAMFVNATRQATTLVFASATDLLAPAGNTWLAHARDALASAANGTVDGWFVGMPIDSWDSINAVNAYFPIIVGASAGVVLLIIGVIFGSALIALRSVVTLSLTLSAVFGAMTLVYDAPSLLTWTHVPGLANSDGVTWLIPVICFSIVVGISLDYDVFLISRVVELRTMGYNTRDAIRAAQYFTGPVITVAGVIMAVAFSGLLASNTASLNQMGFILAFSVLVDTFVIRIFFVPSIMALLGDANWWPLRKTAPTATLPDPYPRGAARGAAPRLHKDTSVTGTPRQTIN